MSWWKKIFLESMVRFVFLCQNQKLLLEDEASPAWIGERKDKRICEMKRERISDVMRA